MNGHSPFSVLTPKLPEPLEVEKGNVLVNGVQCPILKRNSAKPEKPGMVGTGLTEYVYFHYNGDDYIGFFGFFHGRFCIKFARRTKPLPRDTITYVKVVIRDKTKSFKKMGYGHSSVARIDQKKDYDIEHHTYENILARLRILYTGRELREKIDELKQHLSDEMGIALSQIDKAIENGEGNIRKIKNGRWSKVMNVDIPRTQIKRVTKVRGKDMEIA